MKHSLEQITTITNHSLTLYTFFPKVRWLTRPCLVWRPWREVTSQDVRPTRRCSLKKWVSGRPNGGHGVWGNVSQIDVFSWGWCPHLSVSGDAVVSHLSICGYNTQHGEKKISLIFMLRISRWD